MVSKSLFKQKLKPILANFLDILFHPLSQTAIGPSISSLTHEMNIPLREGCVESPTSTRNKTIS